MEVSNLRRDSRMPSYMIYPRFLMKMTELPDTAKIVYMHLLDRGRLSMQHSDWIDRQGRVYMNYTIENLAGALGKSETTVKTSLRALEKAGLIQRVRQGTCKPNRIYVMLPEAENRPNDSQKTAGHWDRKPPASNTYDSYKNYQCEEDESL